MKCARGRFLASAGGPSRLLFRILPLAAVAFAGSAAGQARMRHPLGAGGEAEEYLRFLQTTGEVAPYPWTVRAFSRAEGDRLVSATDHPWARWREVRGDTTGAAVVLLPVRVRGGYNSAFPYGTNDGAVWAGRGGVASVQGGIALRAGILSISINPTAFVAENREFGLRGNGQGGDSVYADGLHPAIIDQPQRFGPGRYARVDPGESYARLDAGVVALGVSTATEVWGPGSEYPILLGGAGPGFPHAFAGTARLLNLGLARVHGRVVYGRTEQSAYSPVREGTGTRRFASGIVAMIQPRRMGGLELGGARFFHTPWPEDGLSGDDLGTPFRGIFPGRSRPDSADGGEFEINQLASVFFRWPFVRSGFEAYGEYARNDYSANARDLLLEPDHASAYMLGVRRAWRPSPTRMATLRAEVLNARVSHLVNVRSQAPFTVHTGVRQGHTHFGQPLGARAAYGGAGAIVAADLYHPRGRWSASWTREERGAPDPSNPDG
ncbi:MAG: hypothetical protein ICV87_15155, partial [Gemmatimonadetes bacterium]|nr:hypothetical protein [Gemmatimonadota bacterium]